jgi:formylglycine-generating enzyme required for sulfatase activity
MTTITNPWINIPPGRVTLPAGGNLPTAQTVEVRPFAIATYPVTNQQYAPFVAAGGYTQRDWWDEEGWPLQQKHNWTEPRYWTDRDWSEAGRPVVGVSWYEAMAFCRWLSAQTGQPITLPGEAQWQRAAQGDDGREFPWGSDTPTDNLCNWNRNVDETTPVTHYPAGASPYGVIDMSGNVWEWLLTGWHSGTTGNMVGDPVADGPEARLLRGGCWSSDSPLSLRVFHRHPGDPNARLQPKERNLVTVGFRCAIMTQV